MFYNVIAYYIYLPYRVLCISIKENWKLRFCRFGTSYHVLYNSKSQTKAMLFLTEIKVKAKWVVYWSTGLYMLNLKVYEETIRIIRVWAVNSYIVRFLLLATMIDDESSYCLPFIERVQNWCAVFTLSCLQKYKMLITLLNIII